MNFAARWQNEKKSQRPLLQPGENFFFTSKLAIRLAWGVWIRFTSYSPTGEELVMEACGVPCNSSPFHFPLASVTTGPVFQPSGWSEKAREAHTGEGLTHMTRVRTTEIWGCGCSALICCQWPCTENRSSIWGYVKGIAEQASASKMLLFWERGWKKAFLPILSG